MAAALTRSLWDAEIEALFAAAPNLSASATSAVVGVLRALVLDDDMDNQTRLEIGVIIAKFRRFRLVAGGS